MSSIGLRNPCSHFSKLIVLVCVSILQLEGAAQEAKAPVPEEAMLMAAKAYQAWGNEKHYETIDYASKGIKICGTYDTLFMFRASGYLAIDEYDKAIDDATQAILLGNDKSITNLSLRIRAAAYKSKEQWRDAISDATELIRVDPKGFVKAYGIRGYCYLMIGDFAKAETDFKSALELQPNDTDYLASLAAAQVNQGKSDNATTTAKQALATNPKDVKSLWILAQAKYNSNDVDTALSICDQALAIDPSDSNTITLKAICFRKKGQPKRAMALLDSVLAKSPKYEKALRNRALANLESGAAANSIPDLLLLTQIAPEDEAYQKQLDDAITTVRKSGRPVKVLDVRLDDNLTQQVVKKSPPILLAVGSQKTVEDVVRVRHSVEVSDSWNASLEVKGGVHSWFAEIEAGVRGGIEKKTSQTYGTETERKRSVTLNGGSTAAQRVVWVNYLRHGVAKLSFDGVEVDMPFSFRDDFDLISQPVE